MANTHINIRMDEDVKKRAQILFSDMGFDISTAVNMFIRQALRERSLPFKPTTIIDPFFSEAHQAMLNRRISDIAAGHHVSTHELIEVDND